MRVAARQEYEAKHGAERSYHQLMEIYACAVAMRVEARSKR